MKALADSNNVDATRPAYEKWVETRNRLIYAFDPARHNELRTEFDDYRNAVELMSDLRDDTIGQQEWFDYNHARADLAKRGLDTAVDFCIQQRVPENDVPNVAMRALLRAWADAAIQSDQRLRPLLANDREAWWRNTGPSITTSSKPLPPTSSTPRTRADRSTPPWVSPA